MNMFLFLILIFLGISLGVRSFGWSRSTLVWFYGSHQIYPPYQYVHSTYSYIYFCFVLLIILTCVQTVEFLTFEVITSSSEVWLYHQQISSTTICLVLLWYLAVYQNKELSFSSPITNQEQMHTEKIEV